MRDLLRDLYSDTPPPNDLGVSAVAQQYRAHCCKTCQSNYLLYPEEDVTTAVANAACLGVGLGALCADVVESLNAILTRAYNDHTAGPGGMPGATSLAHPHSQGAHATCGVTVCDIVVDTSDEATVFFVFPV